MPSVVPYVLIKINGNTLRKRTKNNCIVAPFNGCIEMVVVSVFYRICILIVIAAYLYMVSLR